MTKENLHSTYYTSPSEISVQQNDPALKNAVITKEQHYFTVRSFQKSCQTGISM